LRQAQNEKKMQPKKMEKSLKKRYMIFLLDKTTKAYKLSFSARVFKDLVSCLKRRGFSQYQRYWHVPPDQPSVKMV
jgi:hypothetical protein